MKNLKKLSETIKKTRAIENIYYGEFYSKDEIKEILNNIDYTKYLGQGKNRTLLKDNKKLYHSILEHTKKIDDVKGVNLRARIQYILEEPIVDCECGRQRKYCLTNFVFLKYCQKCRPVYPSIRWFEYKYGENWKVEHDKDKRKRQATLKGNLSLKWFEDKFGKDGLEKYNKHYQKIFDSRFTTPYSKISQELFWLLADKLPDKKEIFFAEYNKEKHINLNKSDKLTLGDMKRVRINLDFVYKNKVIEFNGNYWHGSAKNRKNDLNRKEICEGKGYDVLFVWENEFKTNPSVVIDRCIRFLTSKNGVRINDRYLIETVNGYESFDNIVNKGKSEILKISTENETISVSKEHTFVVNGIDVKAHTLKIGDYLETKNGLEYITDVKQEGIQDVFDVLHTDSNTYIANNINNHNCAFLGSSATLISPEKLKEMESKIPEEIRDGKLNIYHYPEKGHRYIMGVDAAKDGRDAFGVQIIDITDFNFKQVASGQIQIDYLLMPEFLYEWCELYNNPYLIIENNEGAGQSIADQLYQSYEYENLHFDTKTDTNATNKVKSRKKYPGFRTTTKSRKQILQTMKLFIENNKLEINDSKTISEFFTFLLNGNKYEADEGCHDDMVMSLALIFAPFCSTKNFEDMKVLVKNLYNDDLPDEDKVGFGETLIVGSFDDGTEEDFMAQTSNEYQETWNGHIIEDGGFY